MRSVRIFGTGRRACLATIGATLVLAFSASPAFAVYATRTLRVSGMQAAQSNGAAHYAAVSSKGRFVAFQSTATNLAGGSDHVDVFVRDVRSSSIRLVSVATGGAVADGPSVSPSISSDGNRIAFASGASNLFAGDTNGSFDVLMRTMATGVTIPVSVSSAGVLSDGHSYAPSVSADGRWVAFVSSATNLVDGDTAGLDDIFVRDTATGTTVRLSVGLGGAEANGRSGAPAISADGRKVAFASSADNLVWGDTNRASDIFVVDVASRAVSRVSISSGRAQANLGSSAPAINRDGTRVAFESLATNLVRGDTNEVRDVFVRNLAAARTYRVSVSSAGAQVKGESREPAISAKGTRVVFSSPASGLVARDTNGRADVFMRDLSAAKTTRISAGGGRQANGASGGVAMAPDGTRAAYHTESSNLLVADTNRQNDVVVAAFGPRAYARVQGASPYATAVAASKRAYPAGAGTVVVVNGSDWRSGLAGAALAGATNGTIVYTARTALPAVTRAEIVRVGAQRIYVVGGSSAVSAGVQSSLAAIVGEAGVSRISGRDAYATGAAVAAEVVRVRGPRFDGTVLVASGKSFSGSVGGVPLAASSGRPVVFVNPANGRYTLPTGTRRAVILGGTGSVSRAVSSSLKRRLGTARVVRLSGADRYATAAAAAAWGTRSARLGWDGVTLVNPNTTAAAICGGVMAGRNGSVVLATPSGPLPAVTRARLVTYAARVDIVHFMGSSSTIRAATVSAVKKALGG